MVGGRCSRCELDETDYKHHRAQQQAHHNGVQPGYLVATISVRDDDYAYSTVETFLPLFVFFSTSLFLVVYIKMLLVDINVHSKEEVKNV